MEERGWDVKGGRVRHSALYGFNLEDTKFSWGHIAFFTAAKFRFLWKILKTCGRFFSFFKTGTMSKQSIQQWMNNLKKGLKENYSRQCVNALCDTVYGRNKN